MNRPLFIASEVSSVISQLLLLAAVPCFSLAFSRYSWGTPQVTLVLIPSLVFLALWISSANRAQKIPSVHCDKISVALSLTAITVSACLLAPGNWPALSAAPENDIGLTTVLATSDFWRAAENPYDRLDLNPRPELAPEYRGFHYGPGMLLAFSPSAIAQPSGYRLASLFWAVVFVAFTAALSFNRRASRWSSVSSSLFCAACLLSSPILWRELGTVGVNDAAPMALVSASLFFASRSRWGVSGLLMGLSFSCKFSPAIFAVVALARLSTPRKFWISCLPGLLLMAPFFAADPSSAANNIFMSRLAVLADPSSLYRLFPPNLHAYVQALFPLTALSVVLRNFWSDFSLPSVLRAYAVLTAAGMMSHKEIHANHVLWLIASASVLIAMNRYSVLERAFPKPPHPPSFAR